MPRRWKSVGDRDGSFRDRRIRVETDVAGDPHPVLRIVGGRDGGNEREMVFVVDLGEVAKLGFAQVVEG